MDEILRPLAETFAKVILGYLADELKARHKESQEVLFLSIREDHP